MQPPQKLHYLILASTINKEAIFVFALFNFLMQLSYSKVDAALTGLELSDAYQSIVLTV